EPLGRTIPSQFTQPAPDPSASKRLCFYKSGDYTFSGHRLVVNARTFKTFDALLDALSKKVPLPFGVRTITTPRGTHLVKALDDLHDGGSYVCSDQKRVKPLNLEEVNRRQVPWNTTRSTKITERVAVRTPKRLLVIKNKDPTLRRTIVLQRRTAPTFDALLDYLSQILQFPVLKLYSTDGRRVDGLAALILCSGVLVAAGSEPFRLGSYTFSGLGQIAPAPYGENPVEPLMIQSRVCKNKNNFFSCCAIMSINFSLSSERYIINQINKSQNGSLAGGNHQNQPKKNHQLSNHHASMEAYNTERIDTGHCACIIPQDDDIEKSFRINQDGSMTVEMKVHLTIKEEEVLHWTTTLSRSSTSNKRNCASYSESEHNSPDVNNVVGKASCSVSDAEAKEDNCLGGGRKEVGFNGYSSGASENTKNSLKRSSTPGPRHINKKVSVESMKMVSKSGIQENTLGHYSYMETTADGETMEGYCVVQHSSSSGSSKPIPIPRKTASAGTRDKHSKSSIRSSGVAEVLQIQNNGMESLGCYDNYFANEDYSVDSVPLDGSATAPTRQHASDSAPSSRNDCDIDCSWQPPTAGSQQRQKEEMLSLSSEPTPLTCEKTNNMSSQSLPQESLKKDNNPRRTKRKTTRSARNQKSSTSTSSTDMKQRENKANSSKNIKVSSFGKLGSDAIARKNGYNSSESTKRSKEEKKVEQIQSKKSIQDKKLPKESTLSFRSEPMKRTPSERQNLNKAPARENGYNVNTPSARPQMKKNMTEFLQTNKANTLGKKKTMKPKFLTETTTPTLRKPLELADSVSMPLLNPLDNPSPDEVHQYVENWLEQANPDPVPYTEGDDETESRTKVVFQIGGDTESDEKNGHQTNLDENHLSFGNAVKKSTSCLSVPLSHAEMSTSLQNNEWKTRGLCVSMPTFRVDPVHHENRLRSHQSVEAIGPENYESTSSNILSPKLKIQPVLKQLCSSIQFIRRASAADTTSNLEKSNSLPDFPTQVASVFGSSCKALFSFLSVMTLRDSFGEGDGSPSKTTSEAKLMMESLQKISTIDDEEEQRASLTDLRGRASSQFRERWKDFVTLRERLESEPLSPRFSETEFALDVISEVGDAFEDQQLGINELMEELNMTPELRAEIVATIQQTKSFYPVEESTFIETEKNMSDSEEDVEQFLKESKSETTLSEDHDSIDEGVNRRTSDGDPIKMNHMISAYNQELDACDAQTEEEEPIKEKEAEEEEKVQEVYSDTNEIEGRAEADGGTEEDLMSHEEEQQDESETDRESAEKVEEELSEGEEEVGEEEEETTGASIVEDTDEREGAENTEEENKMEEEEEIIEGNDVGSDHFSEEEEEAATESGEGKKDVENNLQEEKDDEEEEEEEVNVIENTDNVVEVQAHLSVAKDVKEEDNEESDRETHVPEKQEEEEEIQEVDEKEEKVDEEVIEVDELEKVEEEDNAVSEEDNKPVEKKQDEEHEDGEEESSDDSFCKGTTEAKEESTDDKEAADESEIEGNMTAEQPLEVDEKENNEKELNEEESQLNEAEEDVDSPSVDNEEQSLQQVIRNCEEAHVESKSFSEKDSLSDSNEEPSLQQSIRNCEETKVESKSFSFEDQCEDEKVNGIEVVNEEQSDEGEGNTVHPVEISQELLDFVNHALRSSSLLFTYDSQGNLRLEPDTERMLRIQKTAHLKNRQDSLYGSKCLPSPYTSDLSDYRPETSESRGCKSQESEDIISESGEEPSFLADSPHKMEQVTSRVLDLGNAGSLSSKDSVNKTLKEVMSLHSAASTSKTPGKESADGVLIDQGRWLLKENHLIRKSPPASLSMYANLDSISTDASQENNGEDSPSYLKTQHSPLVALSSSELEEMARPQTPKCTYFNMPHGSDSDPFLDDCSVKSGKKHSRGVNGRNFKVSPIVDTSKTWANKNGSMSSFASVEFRISDRKVHPEGEHSAVSQVRRTSSGEESTVRSRDTLNALRVRCGQYCPIL
uniref:Doublecortin domain-containing protein n=1 Tax=Gouania willdenowi TaxID=441366 RepID=A0A8C5I9J1_GOUWI